MRKIINYIIALCCLCFVIEAKAQQAPVLMSLEQKLNSLNAQQKEAFEEIRRGTPSMLSFYDEDEVVRNIEDSSPKIQVVELHEASLLTKLKNTDYRADFDSAKLLIVRVKDGDQLHVDDLALFGSLKYILLKSYDRIDQVKASRVVHSFLENQGKLSAVEIFYTFIGSEG